VVIRSGHVTAVSELCYRNNRAVICRSRPPGKWIWNAGSENIRLTWDLWISIHLSGI